MLINEPELYRKAKSGGGSPGSRPLSPTDLRSNTHDHDDNNTDKEEGTNPNPKLNLGGDTLAGEPLSPRSRYLLSLSLSFSLSLFFLLSSLSYYC